MQGQVVEAVNSMLSGFVVGALAPVSGAAGQLLTPPDAAMVQRLRELWSVSVGIANSLAVLLVLAGGVLVMSHGSLQSRYLFKDIAPRIVVGFLAANCSWLLVTTAIELSRALAVAVAVDGLTPDTALTQLVINTVTGGLGFMILLGLVVTIMMAALAVTMLVVIAVLCVLIVAAPLALICHTLPGLDAIAAAWWKAMLAALAVPMIQTLILAAMVRVALFSPAGAGTALPGPSTVLTVLTVIALVYLMIKVPSWLLRPALRGGAGRGGGGRRRSRIASLIKTVLAVKTLGLAFGATSATAGAACGAGSAAGRGGWRGLLGSLGKRGNWFAQAANVAAGRVAGHNGHSSPGPSGPSGGLGGGSGGGGRGGSGAGVLGGLAAQARAQARYRPRRMANLGPVSFLAPAPASHHRGTHTAHPPSATVFTEPTPSPGGPVPGPTPIVPRFQSPTPVPTSNRHPADKDGPADNPATTRAAPSTARVSWSDPPRDHITGKAARAAAAATRASAAVFLTPTPRPPATAPGGATRGVGAGVGPGGRGYHRPAHPVVFSGPAPGSAAGKAGPVGYRAAPLHPVLFPHPPAKTPPTPNTTPSLPRRPTPPRPATTDTNKGKGTSGAAGAAKKPTTTGRGTGEGRGGRGAGGGSGKARS